MAGLTASDRKTNRKSETNVPIFFAVSCFRFGKFCFKTLPLAVAWNAVEKKKHQKNPQRSSLGSLFNAKLIFEGKKGWQQ